LPYREWPDLGLDLASMFDWNHTKFYKHVRQDMAKLFLTPRGQTNALSVLQGLNKPALPLINTEDKM